MAHKIATKRELITTFWRNIWNRALYLDGH